MRRKGIQLTIIDYLIDSSRVGLRTSFILHQDMATVGSRHPQTMAAVNENCKRLQLSESFISKTAYLSFVKIAQVQAMTRSVHENLSFIDLRETFHRHALV